MVYLAHLLDERFFGEGTAAWATEHTHLYFTNTAWFWVNLPSFVLFSWTAALAASGRLPVWCQVGLCTHLLLHALARVVGSLGTATLAPGVITGVALCTPAAFAVLARARPSLSQRGLAVGSAVGLASFQPLWHFLLHPFLAG